MSTLDDRHQIIEQLNLLAYAFDHREWALVASVMTPDVHAYGHSGLDDVPRDGPRIDVPGRPLERPQSRRSEICQTRASHLPCRSAESKDLPLGAEPPPQRSDHVRPY